MRAFRRIMPRWGTVWAALVLWTMLMLTLGLVAVPSEAATLPQVRIGIVVDGPWSGNAAILDQTVREIRALTEGEFDVAFSDDHVRVADWTLEGTRAEIDRLLADPDVDLVIAWGLLASHAVCCYAELPKPVVAPVILDQALQDLPLAEHGGSGRTHLSYVSLPDSTRSEIEALREIVPFQRIAFLVRSAIQEAIPQLHLRTQGVLADTGLDVTLVAVDDSVDEALAAIDAANADAVYLWPLFHLSPAELARLMDGINARKLPSFSSFGGSDIEAGVLATLGGTEFLPRLTRRVALNIQRILLGEPASKLPVAFAAQSRLSINMATARAIDVSPRWETLIEANLLNVEDEANLERLSLATVVQTAVASSLGLRAERRGVMASEQDIVRARSDLLPQVEVGVTGVTIDDDRAAASFGAQSERSVTGGLGVSQLIFSDAARANVTIQERRQRARELAVDVASLDVAFDAAVTYLDMLRAKTLSRVQQNNLQLTRSNLERARVRRSIGAGSPAEVYRWESQIANDRRSLINARATIQAAAITINRLLNRDLETPFATEEVGLEDPGLITSPLRFRGYIDTPRLFRVLRDFTVQAGLAAAPELQQLDESIAATERQVLAAHRAFVLPSIGAQFSLDRLLAGSGAGSDATTVPGVPTADDTTWTLGVSATLPLFQGRRRSADRTQAELTLEQLKLERASVAESLEQRIRVATIAARASFSGIELSRQASEAATANLELVSDSYARGAVPIIDLLDAQNAALNADLDAANAVYDFFIDLMEVQRAANRFDFFTSPASRDAWFESLDDFYAEAGVEPWR